MWKRVEYTIGENPIMEALGMMKEEPTLWSENIVYANRNIGLTCGGIPIPREIKDVRINEKTGEKEEYVKEILNDYTTHVDMSKILRNDEAGKTTLLFIDELNRADHGTQQELMQVINERYINKIHLPDSCLIMAAGNPDDGEINYQVNIMNDAFLDRFMFFNMVSDHNEWINWAISKGNIVDEVVEFIADSYEMLHGLDIEDEIRPTPRSWDHFSQVLNVIKTEKDIVNLADETNLIANIGRGSIGLDATNAFISFIHNKDNPLLNSTELILTEDENELKEFLEILGNETAPRTNIIMNRVLRDLNKIYESKGEKSFKKNKFDERFIKIMDVIGEDIMYGVLLNITNNYENLQNVFINNPDYLSIYFDANRRIEQIS